ncbi:hypothetical protein DIPPA_07018 [Diplonema papillatum]|nr:hypothetical protein DIPPA_07018 [Diplonema papillatum]
MDRPGHGPGDRYNPAKGLGARGGIRQSDLDMLTEAVYSDLKGIGGIRSVPTAAPPAKGGDEDILGAMCKRLKQAETANAELRRELAKKEKEAMSLQRNATSKSDVKDDEIAVLKEQNERLALQVVEMTQFLNEQGLQWVGSGRVSPLVGRARSRGDSNSASPAPSGQHSPSSGDSKDKRLTSLASLPGVCDGVFRMPGTEGEDAEPKDDPPAKPVVGNEMYFSLALLKEKVAELNLAAGEKVIRQEQRLGDGRQVSKFVDPDAVEVVMYKDGICVDRGVFRPYSWPLCRAFLDDLLEGFFPYEYRDKYPQGMLIDLVEKVDILHPAAPQGNVHAVGIGEGYRAVTKDAFLRRLPKQVITATGAIVTVRQDVGSFMGHPAAAGGGPSDTIHVSHQTDDADPAAKPVLLQVRLVGGGRVVARMSSVQTIGDVRKIVAAQLAGENVGKPFELLTAFPRVTFTDDSQTLEAANLVPNAALLMRVQS